MLVRLFGRNFRSLRNDFELSLVAADLTREEDCDRGVIEVPIKGMKDPLRLLRAVAIYGANASGKTSVLLAAGALRWLATDSSGRMTPGAPVPPYEPFALDRTARKAPVALGCDVVLGNSLIRYQIEFKEKQVVTEKLVQLDGDEETVLIDRTATGKVGGDLILRSEANQLYVKEMQPNVSVLSKLAQHGPQKGDESVQPYYRAIRQALRAEDYSVATAMQVSVGFGANERLASERGYRDWILEHLMRPADFGIRGLKIRREKLEIPNTVRQLIESSPVAGELPDTHVVVAFLHDGGSEQAIEFQHESAGTKKLFNIAPDWWSLANDSITLLADELSASLHPRLLDQLVRAVNDPEKARVRSQLIFATHDTGLMEGRDGLPPALRRDQVFFTKKDDHGASELYSLAEFKDDARPVHNIRKRYLSGLYGAIPLVEKLSL